MSTNSQNPDLEVTNIFNSYVAAVAIGAAWEVGLLDEVRRQDEVDISDYAAEHDLDRLSIQGLASALSVVDIIQRQKYIIKRGQLFEGAYRTKGLFHWLALGSGPLFSCMHRILRNKNRIGDYYSRDSTAISYACRDANVQYFDPAFLNAINSSDCEPHSVVDLGSGSGERLMQLLDRYPESNGIGIDIAGPAIEVAMDEASRRGYGGRLSFFQGDVRELDYRDEFSQVDLLTSFLMGHDFWPRERCVTSLRRLLAAFPNVRRFFLCDTMKILIDNPQTRQVVEEKNMPIFTLGFEFGHALMGISLPTVEDWEGVFEEGGWHCIKQHHMMPPSLSIIFELQPASLAR